MNDDFNLYLTAQKRYGEVTDAAISPTLAATLRHAADALDAMKPAVESEEVA